MAGILSRCLAAVLIALAFVRPVMADDDDLALSPPPDDPMVALGVAKSMLAEGG